MRVGAKSMTAATLLAASAWAAVYFGRVRADYLAQLDPWATFVIGAFAVVTANAVFHFGRLGQPSEHHLRIEGWGRPRFERADPFGRTPKRKPRWWRRSRGVLMRGAYALVFLQVGLLTIDNRGVALLASVPDLFEASRHGFCLQEEAPEAEDPRLAGCGLLRRAYALGYAKDLGPCAPKEEEIVDTICYRRQLDEPYLHYAWRLFEKRRAEMVPGSVADFRWGQAVDLLQSQYDTIAQTPRASHHLYTNLPPPRAGAVRQVVEALDAAACDDRTARMPHVLDVEGDPRAASLILEHVMGQLLLNPAYPTVVASCREHTIHWNAPEDACDRLAADAEAFLDSDGTLANVRAAVARHRRAQLAWRLANEEGRRRRGRSPPIVTRIVSFQCLMVDGSSAPPGANRHRLTSARSAVEERSATLDGRKYAVRSTRVTAYAPTVRSQIDLFRRMAYLFAPGFTYGRLQSEQFLADVDAGRAAAKRFADRNDLLTKLELLRETDIFLGHEWIDQRPDLLAVYPYQVHLTNFVEAFRRHYQHARARL